MTTEQAAQYWEKLAEEERNRPQWDRFAREECQRRAESYQKTADELRARLHIAGDLCPHCESAVLEDESRHSTFNAAGCPVCGVGFNQ